MLSIHKFSEKSLVIAPDRHILGLMVAKGTFIIAGLALATLVSGTVTAQTICREQRIKADEPSVFSSFGFDVALWGDTAVVGEPNLAPTATGRALVFDYTDSTGWIETVILTPSDGKGNDRFGDAVAIEGDMLAVGARLHDDPAVPGRGAVYVWRRIKDQWVFEQKILPPREGNNFGRLIEFDSGRAIVTQPPVIHIYELDGASWKLLQTLPVTDPGSFVGYAGSASLAGNVLVVGARNDGSMCDDPDGIGLSGLVYVYRFNGNEFVEEQILAPSNPDCQRQFGHAVAISGNTILASAQNPFTTHVFEYDELTEQWLETAILPAGPFDPRPRAASIQDDLAIIGNDASFFDGPKATAFQRMPDGDWNEITVLYPEPNPWSSFFGWAVTIHGNRAIIGAHGEDQQRGAAYIFRLDAPLGDLTCDGTVDVVDLVALFDAWGPCPAVGLPGTCAGSCGEQSPDGCWCDDSCCQFDDCCEDKFTICGGCDPALGTCPADLNGDGAVNVADLLILFDSWG
jgi:hypothetical protein